MKVTFGFIRQDGVSRGRFTAEVPSDDLDGSEFWLTDGATDDELSPFMPGELIAGGTVIEVRVA